METENVSVAERPLVSVALTETLSDVAEVGAVPEKVSVAALNLSQVGSAEPLESVALYVRVSCRGSVKVLAGSAMLKLLPPVNLCDGVGFVTTGAEAGVSTEMVSELEAPPLSVAVTLMLSPFALTGTVPVNVSVAALKDSHVGRAEPLASVAL